MGSNRIIVALKYALHYSIKSRLFDFTIQLNAFIRKIAVAMWLLFVKSDSIRLTNMLNQMCHITMYVAVSCRQ